MEVVLGGCILYAATILDSRMLLFPVYQHTYITIIYILEICVHLLLWIINSTECMVYTSKYSPLCFSPRVHGGDNDVGNLIVSECLPETSRPALYFSDDYSNINYVSNSSEIGSFPSHATGVRSVEMNRVWCNVIGYELLWNYSLKILSPAVII